jgi:hypothetical protein
MTDWKLSNDANPAESQAFGSLDRVFNTEGELITRDPLSKVIRTTVAGTRYYLKLYTGSGKNPLRDWLGRPRVQAEWENLQKFITWGIPTARIVGYGLETRFGRFTRGALITEEIPNTRDLAALSKAADPRLRKSDWIDNVSRQVAGFTQMLHSHRFAHNDLKWRNILVSDSEPPKVSLIDCPSGATWIEPFFGYRRIKDLACLDKVAKRTLRRTQRLRFLLRYLQQEKLRSADKRLITKIVHFFDGRD